MYLKFFIPLFLLVTFNYNFTLLQKDCHMKYRLLTWIVLQWGGRIAAGIALVVGFLRIRHVDIAQLNLRQVFDLLFILLAVNVMWTLYERKRDQHRCRLKAYYYKDEYNE
jgi:hypothetical protein